MARSKSDRDSKGRAFLRIAEELARLSVQATYEADGPASIEIGQAVALMESAKARIMSVAIDISRAHEMPLFKAEDTIDVEVETQEPATQPPAQPGLEPEKIVLPPPADFYQRCNVCGFTRLKSVGGPCPKNHVGGWAYAGPADAIPGIETEQAQLEKNSQSDSDKRKQKTVWLRYIVETARREPLYVIEAPDQESARTYVKQVHQVNFDGQVRFILNKDWVKLPHWVTTRKIGQPAPTEAEMRPPRGFYSFVEPPAKPETKPEAEPEKPARRRNRKTFAIFYQAVDGEPPIKIEEMKAVSFDEARASLPKLYAHESIRLPNGDVVRMDHDRLTVGQVAGKPKRTQEAASARN